VCVDAQISYIYNIYIYQFQYMKLQSLIQKLIWKSNFELGNAWLKDHLLNYSAVEVRFDYKLLYCITDNKLVGILQVYALNYNKYSVSFVVVYFYTCGAVFCCECTIGI